MEIGIGGDRCPEQFASTVDHADIRGLVTALLSSVMWAWPQSRNAHRQRLLSHNAVADCPLHRVENTGTSEDQALVDGRSKIRAASQMKPASSRATAVTATLAGLLRAVSRRYL